MSPRPLRLQTGLSIVELLVALALGMLLLTGVTQVFLSTRQTISTTEAMARVQENGRFALEFISQSARVAGYQEPYLITTKPGIVGSTGSSSCGTLCSRDSTASASERVTFILQPPLIKDDPNATANRRDCAGNGVAEGVVIANSYYIAPADANNPNPSLACVTFNTATPNDPSAPVRLVDGIETMQVLYGIGSSSDPTSVNRYVSAARVSSLNAWGRVTAVRIGLIANSLKPIGGNEPLPSQFVVLDESYAPAVANDRLARQVFSTTIRFHNIN
jgi:type IV pilus assembly protein PilW